MACRFSTNPARTRNQPLSLVAEDRWFEHMVQLPPVEQVLSIWIIEGEGWKLNGN